VTFKEAGWLLPGNTNAWVSHVFKAQENPDGTFTYWGATGDFNLGERGRNAIDVYRVTLPAPPLPADGPGVVGKAPGVTPRSGGPVCVPGSAFRSATVRARGRRLSFAFDATAPVTIDVFRQSRGRSIGTRLVKRFRGASGAIAWNGRDRRGRPLRSGTYMVRFTARTASGAADRRRFALVLRKGRFRRAPAFARTDSCALLRTFKLLRPVFGGRSRRALGVAFRLGEDAQVSVAVRRGMRTVRRFAARSYTAGTTHRVRVPARRLRRGLYAVRITVRTASGERVTRTLRSRLL
jgi:hypothetical protein